MIETVTCVTVTCDGCNEVAPLYEDMGTAHYPSIEDARKQLIDNTADEPEFRWSVEGDEWFCPSCTAARICEAAGGHDWNDWDDYGGPWAFRACRRGACQASERRPAEATS